MVISKFFLDKSRSNFFTEAGYHETKGLLSKEIRFGTIICPRSNSQFGEKIQNLSIEGIIWRGNLKFVVKLVRKSKIRQFVAECHFTRSIQKISLL